MQSFDVSDAHRQEFRAHGFTILPRVISNDLLQLLRQVCDDAVARVERANGERASKHHLDVWNEDARLKQFAFSPLMAEITRALLGETAFLFFQEFVVETQKRDAKLDWHQNSGYVARPQPPYLCCWCALDDMNENSGTIYLLPYERAGTREVVPHTPSEGANASELVGYRGDDPGDAMVCAAGSIVAFSSHVFHRAGALRAARRRVYLAQYSSTFMLHPDGTQLNLAEPFLRDGQVVAHV